MTAVDAEVLYVALIGDPVRLRGLHRLQYRCDTEDRCLLLDAIEVPEPERILLHQKRFKNSSEVNRRRSSEAGRAKNTFDGNRHWKPRTYYLTSSALAHPDDLEVRRQSLQCDHVGELPDGGDMTLTAPDFRDDWEAGHAEVRVRRDGTRYAVR